MKIILCSDTHGNHDLLQHCINTWVPMAPDLVIHLGDDYVDGELILNHNLPCLRIPGTWCPMYSQASIENRRFETFLNWRFFLTHTPTSDGHDLSSDPVPESVLEQGKIDIFCHGHTHAPRITEDHGVTIINPGHLKAEMDRGHPASFAILTLSETDCQVEIINLVRNTKNNLIHVLSNDCKIPQNK